MRKRNEIEKDGKRPEFLILEVLLDMRDLMVKDKPKRQYKRRAKA